MGHHTVPQRYLVNFQDPERPGFIWLHDKRGGDPRCAPITKALQQPGFYSEDMEKTLAREVELPANRVIDVVLKAKLDGSTIRGAESISHNQRLALAVYVGAMMRRGPSHRRWALGLLPGTLADVIGNIRRQLKELAEESDANQELLASRDRELDLVHEKFLRETPQSALDQIQNPLPSELITWAILSMNWRILISSGPQYFITTDTPAFFFRAAGYGLGNPDSELSIALSTTHALHGSRQGPPGGLLYVGARQRCVREINRRLASQTDRLAVYHRSAPWLMPLLAKENPYLSRIEW
jgi:hypothetical protein